MSRIINRHKDQPKRGKSISVRKIEPDFSDCNQKFWFDGNPFTTHLINTLSFQFPSGEENFVKSVNHYKSSIKDRHLRADIKKFTSQELLHGKVHDAFNSWIASRVPEANTYCERIAALAKKRYNRAFKKNPILNLGVTTGLEHITAIMAANLLNRPDILDKIEIQPRALLIWHSIEEIEHKDVAFDVFKEVGGTYKIRAITMIVATLVFIGQTLFFQSKLLIRDRQLFNLKAAFIYLKDTIGPRGFMSAIVIPYLKYFSKNFHPSQSDESRLIEQWNERLQAMTPVFVDGKDIPSSEMKGA